jgi:hypothetical protein
VNRLFFFFLILSIKLFPKKIDEFGRVDDMKFEMRRIFYWQNGLAQFGERSVVRFGLRSFSRFFQNVGR